MSPEPNIIPKDNVKKAILRIIGKNGWLKRVEKVSFLAAGEYNENYLIESAGEKFVFRINHGSQIGQENQIGYEYNVLKTVEPSGVTPAPFHVDPDTESGGVLMMAFIPGRCFDFSRDLSKVPPIFAAVHSVPLPVSEETLKPPLIRQEHPIEDIARESRGLLDRFVDHPLKKEKETLEKYHDKVVELGQSHEKLFADEPLCLVNTEVNSGNFIIQEKSGKLVDWEKAVISYRYQDLAHFLVPTTTLWKTNFTFSAETRYAFLKAYYQLIQPDFDFDALDFKTALLEKTILLRALSWCYMACYEYTSGDRSLNNPFTFKKIQSYMDNLSCFLK